MKNQINLYHESCFPERPLATFKQFVVLMGACILVVALIKIVFNHQAANIQKAIQAQQMQLETQQQQLATLLDRLQSQRAPQSKLRELDFLEAEISGKKRLLGSLSGVELGVVISFSDLMRGLSLANIDSLSIDKFSVQQGRLNITGKAKNSDSVPLWLTNIQSTDELSEIAFTTLQIHDKDSYFSFDLSNAEQPLTVDKIDNLHKSGQKK
jgi:Tfp pilus assembly protein PilN